MSHKPISPPHPHSGPLVCHSTGWKCCSERKQKHSRGDTSVTQSRGAAVALPTKQDDDEDDGRSAPVSLWKHVRWLPDLFRPGDASQLRVWNPSDHDCYKHNKQHDYAELRFTLGLCICNLNRYRLHHCQCTFHGSVSGSTCSGHKGTNLRW